MEINAIQAGFNLDHLAIETRRKKDLANFYQNIMKMQYLVKKNNDIICIGPSRKLIIKEGINNRLSFVVSLYLDQMVHYAPKKFIN